MLKLWIDRIKRISYIYSHLGLPLRLVISAGITLLAGTGIGFFAEYAAYSWAYYYSIRPPLEGIPYLKVAVTALTVLTLMGGAFSFLAVKLIASYVGRWAERQISRFTLADGSNPMLTALRNCSTMTAILVSFAISLGVALGYSQSSLKLDNILTKNLEVWIAGIFTFFAVMLLWNKKAGTYIALVCVIIVILGVPLSFFNVHVYSIILQKLAYGGGLPVEVTIAGEVVTEGQRTRVDGYLMLRTTSALLIYIKPEEKIREIPLDHVLFLDHKALPLKNRPAQLPSENYSTVN